MDYKDFIDTKLKYSVDSGFEVSELNRCLFDYQDCVDRWALRKGRAAILADTGLGKTLMQLEWSLKVHQHTNKPVLILAPLAVAEQTAKDNIIFGYDVKVCESQADIVNGINITNYEKLHKFDLSVLSGLCLDEGSILKNFIGKIRNQIIELSKYIPYKLSCSATAAPNDFEELGNQAEFLGVMKRTEMLAMFFINDASNTGTWRLKKHGQKEFWKWVSTWAVIIRKPSDLGFSDDRYTLPQLIIDPVVIPTTKNAGQLFHEPAITMSERRQARKDTILERCTATAKIANDNPDKTFLIWCDLNEESKILTFLIDGAVEVTGNQKDEIKKRNMLDFSAGKIRVLVTKPKIAGFGMNWQHIDFMAFCGVSDSFEKWYQCIRRGLRFPRKDPLTVFVVTADIEGNVIANLKRKETQANQLYNEVSKYMIESMNQEVRGKKSEIEYKTNSVKSDKWEMIKGDCCEEIKKIDSDSVGYQIFSPPFSELYTYSDSSRDMGNSKDYVEFWKHFDFLIPELLRILQKGRLCSVHCMNLPIMKSKQGYIGIEPFSHHITRKFREHGFIFHSDVVIWKDPLLEATRTKALGLMHKQLTKDSTKSRQGLPDYLLTFRKAGENENPVSHPEGLTEYAGDPEFSTEKIDQTGIKKSHQIWRNYASPVWMDIRQTNTLNRQAARSEKDEKHICPLQLDVIERALKLWSNPGDLVFSPFTGIGSEGYQALKMDRRFLGIELKEQYFNVALSNLKLAEKTKAQIELF